MDPDTILIHQVHPFKLGVDLSASLVSNFLLWQHRLGAGILSRYLLPVVGSTLVLGFADMDRLRAKPTGRYVLEHMPPQATAVRLAGDMIMAVGSWRRRPGWIVTGAVVVAAGWSHGLFFDAAPPRESRFASDR